MVEWEQRTDGSTPDASFIDFNYMKENYPKLLCDFYETKFKIMNK